MDTFESRCIAAFFTLISIHKQALKLMSVPSEVEQYSMYSVELLDYHSQYVRFEELTLFLESSKIFSGHRTLRSSQAGRCCSLHGQG